MGRGTSGSHAKGVQVVIGHPKLCCLGLDYVEYDRQACARLGRMDLQVETLALALCLFCLFGGPPEAKPCGAEGGALRAKRGEVHQTAGVPPLTNSDHQLM